MDMKYITIHASFVLVRIERDDKNISRKFPIRKYPSLEDALNDAREWRDQTHLKSFGYPVTKKIFQIKRRASGKEILDPKTGAILPELPSGLSYGFHRGRLLYIVVSYQDDGLPKKIRIPIENEQIDKAVKKGLKTRIDKTAKDSY